MRSSTPSARESSGRSRQNRHIHHTALRAEQDVRKGRDQRGLQRPTPAPRHQRGNRSASRTANASPAPFGMSGRSAISFHPAPQSSGFGFPTRRGRFGKRFMRRPVAAAERNIAGRSASEPSSAGLRFSGPSGRLRELRVRTASFSWSWKLIPVIWEACFRVCGGYGGLFDPALEGER